MSSTAIHATPFHTPSHCRTQSEYVAMRSRRFPAVDMSLSPCRTTMMSSTPPRMPFGPVTLESPILLLTPSPLRRSTVAHDSPMHLDLDPYSLMTPFKPSADSSSGELFNSQSPALFRRPATHHEEDEGTFFGATDFSHASVVPQAPKRKVNVLSSSPHARQHSTPLRIQTPLDGDGRGERLPSLAPLPPPSFTRTTVDPDHIMKRGAESMRKLRIGDISMGMESSDDEDAKHVVNKSTIPNISVSKSANEVAEAISPGGHVSKRRAKSRPTSLDMSGISQNTQFPARPNPFAKGHGRKHSNTSVSDAGSPMRVTRASPRPPNGRVVSSATLFFGPAITNPSKIEKESPLKPERPALVTRRSSAYVIPPATPSPLTSSSDDEQDPFATNSANASFTSAFTGPPETSFTFSVTDGSPRNASPGRRIQKKFKKPRDSGIVVSDDEGNSSLILPGQYGSDLLRPPVFHPHARASTQPNPSTSSNSVMSDATLVDDGYHTPGFEPAFQASWPVVNVELSEPTTDVDEFIVKTLTTGGKDRESLGHKKMPNTPQKRTKTAFLGVPLGQRPWASVATTKVVSQMSLFGEKISGPKFGSKGNGDDDDDVLRVGNKKGNIITKPRKTCPGLLQFPSKQDSKQSSKGQADRTSVDSGNESWQISPTNVRESRSRTYGNVGLGRPNISLRAQSLARQSSSRAYSFSSDSSGMGTPTKPKETDWQQATLALKQQYTPSTTNFALSPTSPELSDLADSPTAGLGHQAATVASGAGSKLPGRVSLGAKEAVAESHNPAHVRVRSRRSALDVRGVFRHAVFSAPRPSSEYEQPGRFERDFVEVDDIGSGEFGNAIKVRYKQGGGGVLAVKKSKRFEGVRHRIRLREEVDVLRHLTIVAGGHENVLAYVDSWEQDEALYILTELCEFGNFAHFLEEYGHHFARLDEARVWKILAELSSGLAFIHGAGVIHLDLKPANIFISASGKFRIGDFGMASVWPRPPRFDEAASERGGFEREGDKMYLAAEVLQGRYGKEADVFSLGMTMLETAANIVVPTQGELWHKLRSDDFGPVDGFEGECSGALVGLIKSMMAGDPTRRPGAAAVAAHPVVARARSGMAAVAQAVQGGDEGLFRASPLAGEDAGFLAALLGDAEAMDVC